jgi:glycosyltransferase involved in cell wall biosynthesis
MRVLFLIPHPIEGASSRYRVLQYIPHFEARGIQCQVSSFLSREFYRIAYSQGAWVKKTGCMAISTVRRLWDVVNSKRFDLVFIHREVFPFGPPFLESLLALCKIPIVFDMDDAIFMPHMNHSNTFLRWLRMPSKVGAILKWSSAAIVSNAYLAHYARQFNSNVHVIPTSVDTDLFRPPARRPDNPEPVIGWIGSRSTAPYLDTLKPVFRRLRKRVPFTFKMVGAARPFSVSSVKILQEPWLLEKDVSYFQSHDIGVYPLPEDAWALGKAGLKALQYMAVGVPCVASNVGHNREIVQDGVNGFMARTEDEWVEKLGRLVENSRLRDQLGQAARKTVEERFSMQEKITTYVEILRDAV